MLRQMSKGIKGKGGGCKKGAEYLILIKLPDLIYSQVEVFHTIRHFNYGTNVDYSANY